MKTIKIENITLEIDENKTENFYKTQNTFVCDCSDCVNYLSKIPDVLNSLNGIDRSLGIDLRKAVGQGMDELMPHDFEDYQLYVVPYYVVGKCFLNGIELEKYLEWNENVKTLHPVLQSQEVLEVNFVYELMEFQWKKKDWSHVTEQPYYLQKINYQYLYKWRCSDL